MITVDRYRDGDQAALDALHPLVIGERAASLKQRWNWLYLDNPGIGTGTPSVLVARDGDSVVGQMGSLPVRLQVNGTEIDAIWGTDFMVDPTLQRRGVGHLLADAWESASGAALGLSLTDASDAFTAKRGWPRLPRVPRFAKPLTQRVLREWGRPDRRSASLALPFRRATARWRPPDGDIRRITHFDDAFTRLWERVACRFAFAVRRDAAYLAWKYTRAPHLRYSIAALVDGDEIAGFIVYRHMEDARWRATMLVDYLADPEDPHALVPLLRWLDREAIAANSDLIRVLAPHAGFQRTLKAAGYVEGRATMRMVAKITGVPVLPEFYESNARWHVTQGDADVDR